MSLRLPPPLRVQTALGAIDQIASATGRDASTATVSAVRRVLPVHSGRLRADTTGSVRRTPIGFVITIAPRGKLRYPGGRGSRSGSGGVSTRQVAAFVAGGTGIYGPSGRPIRPRKGHPFRLPSGWSAGAVKGQPAQDPFGRVQSTEEAAITRLIIRGADHAATAAERALGAHR